VVWTGFVWLRIGRVEGSCEHAYEPSCPVKHWEFLDWVSNRDILNGNSVPRSWLVSKLAS
jgi:hypothetical protein